MHRKEEEEELFFMMCSVTQTDLSQCTHDDTNVGDDDNDN